MYAQVKRTTLTDGSYVWSVVVATDDQSTYTEIDCLDRDGAEELMLTLKTHTLMSCLPEIVKS
jgi:hypothetical protein